MEKLLCCGPGRIEFCGKERFPHALVAVVDGELVHASGMFALDAGGIPQGFDMMFVGCIGCIPFQVGCTCVPIPLLVGEEGFSVAKLLITWSGVMAREAGACWGRRTELIAEVAPEGQVGEVMFVVWARCDCGAFPVLLPSTRRSKSSSPTPEDPNGSLDGILIRSFERGFSNPFAEFEASSLSFLVCSCSILEDKLLMRVIYS